MTGHSKKVEAERYTDERSERDMKTNLYPLNWSMRRTDTIDHSSSLSRESSLWGISYKLRVRAQHTDTLFHNLWCLKASTVVMYAMVMSTIVYGNGIWFKQSSWYLHVLRLSFISQRVHQLGCDRQHHVLNCISHALRVWFTRHWTVHVWFFCQFVHTLVPVSYSYISYT